MGFYLLLASFTLFQFSTVGASLPLDCGDKRMAAYFKMEGYALEANFGNQVYLGLREDECLSMCNDNLDYRGSRIFCSGVTYDRFRTNCTVSRKPVAPEGTSTVAAAAKSNYFQKFCLPENAPRECGQTNFLRVSQKYISGYAEAVVKAASMQDCTDACVASRRFQCKSAMYYWADRECILNTESVASLGLEFVEEMFQDSADKVEYFENGCLAEIKSALPVLDATSKTRTTKADLVNHLDSASGDEKSRRTPITLKTSSKSTESNPRLISSGGNSRRNPILSDSRRTAGDSQSRSQSIGTERNPEPTGAGVFSQWAQWTSCDLKSGLELRTRRCLSGVCQGYFIQTQKCEYKGWSDWSSPCEPFAFPVDDPCLGFQIRVCLGGDAAQCRGQHFQYCFFETCSSGVQAPPNDENLLARMNPNNNFDSFRINNGIQNQFSIDPPGRNFASPGRAEPQFATSTFADQKLDRNGRISSQVSSNFFENEKQFQFPDRPMPQIQPVDPTQIPQANLSPNGVSENRTPRRPIGELNPLEIAALLDGDLPPGEVEFRNGVKITRRLLSGSQLPGFGANNEVESRTRNAGNIAPSQNDFSSRNFRGDLQLQRSQHNQGVSQNQNDQQLSNNLNSNVQKFTPDQRGLSANPGAQRLPGPFQLNTKQQQQRANIRRRPINRNRPAERHNMIDNQSIPSHQQNRNPLVQRPHQQLPNIQRSEQRTSPLQRPNIPMRNNSPQTDRILNQQLMIQSQPRQRQAQSANQLQPIIQNPPNQFRPPTSLFRNAGSHENDPRSWNQQQRLTSNSSPNRPVNPNPISPPNRLVNNFPNL